MGLGLRDPLDLIDDVQGDLRLLVFDGETHSCDTAMGVVTPSPPEERGAMIPEAVVDIALSPGMPTTSVQLNPGVFTVLVRGWGTDVVSMRDNVIIASGCAGDIEIAAGETREVNIDLIQIFGEGVCGDGTLSPDEQCDDGNTAPSDGCDGTCRTESFPVSTPPDGMAAEMLPSVAWGPASRMAVAYDSNDDSRDIKLMLLSESAGIISSPSALAVDGVVDVAPSVQTEPAVSIGGGRIAVAWSDFHSAATMGGDVRVRFFTTDRNAAGASFPAVTAPVSGAQTLPSTATRGDGATLVVYQDSASATGVSGLFFPSGATTPTPAMAFAVGTGASGGAAPSVTALPDGFVVALTAGGDVLYQRFSATGTPTDAMARPALDDPAGTQDQPAVAALPDGTFVIAWRDTTGDGAGTGIRARVFRADGAAVSDPVVVNSTTAGDQVEPAAAAGADRFAIAFKSGSEIRAAMLNADGALALNREADPSTNDFVVASGAVGEHAVAAGGPTATPMFIVVYKDTSADATGDIRGRLFPLP